MAIAAAACSREEDDLFEKSSAARANEAIVDFQKILTGAENGWIMSYFPHSSQKFGGYTFILKFDADGTVTAAGEIADPDETASSLYQVNQSAGVTLCFDTYNDILSAVADPAPRIYGSRGEGMAGDNDFLVISADANKVVLKGKKSGSYSTLVPMSSPDWEGYLSALNTAVEDMSYTSFILLKGDVEVPVKATYRTLTFSCTDEEGNAYDKTASFIMTPTSYKMYETVEVMGMEFDELIYDTNSATFSATTDASLILKAVIPPLGQVLADGDWFLPYANLGPWAKTQFDAADAALMDSEREELVYAILAHGDMLDYTSDWGFGFISGPGYAGHFGITATPVGDDKVKMKASGKLQGDASYYQKYCSFDSYINVFGNKTERTFTITTDSKKAPSWLKLTEDANPDNWFILTPEETPYK